MQQTGGAAHLARPNKRPLNVILEATGKRTKGGVPLVFATAVLVPIGNRNKPCSLDMFKKSGSKQQHTGVPIC